MIIAIVVSIAVFFVLMFFVVGIKIVPQTSVYIIERFGSYKRTLKNGISWIIPLVDRVVLKESLKERVLDFPAQDVITKDNVTMKIDTVVYMQITDPKLFSYGVERPLFAVENLTATTLRNLIGDIELDETLTSRDTINEKLRDILDEATDPWGMKIVRVELKNILPPQDIIRAMEKQMRAEREKREQILVAEGRKQAAILTAEGKKAAKILEAEGVKKSIELINSSNPTKESLILKSYESLVAAANGEATTILIPSDVTDVSKLAATFSSVSEATKRTTANKKESSKKVEKMLKEIAEK